jgi:long-chain acyl-CoA synthetase
VIAEKYATEIAELYDADPAVHEPGAPVATAADSARTTG